MIEPRVVTLQELLNFLDGFGIIVSDIEMACDEAQNYFDLAYDTPLVFDPIEKEEIA